MIDLLWKEAAPETPAQRDTRPQEVKVMVRKKESCMFAISHERRRNWDLDLLVSIPLAVLIIFQYIPMYGVQIAFRDYQPVRGILGSP